MDAFLIATGSILAATGILWLWKIVTRKWRERKTYCWLKANTQDKAGMQFKTTTEISQALGLLEDHVRKTCTLSKKIYQRSDRKDSWGIYGATAKSVYEDRGLISV